MSLQLRLYLLLGVMLGILYLIILAVGTALGANAFVIYAIIAVVLVFLQYLIGPSMVSLLMRIKYVTEQEEPELHRMVGDLAQEAKIPKPRVGISEQAIPNAFAFGRTQGDARVCVTRGILSRLNKDELKAVLGHEITHIKNRDMLFITVLSVLPMICYYIAMTLMWSGMFGGRGRRQNEGTNILPLIGIGMLVLYFITNLLVLYGSRIREYFADRGSVKLGNQPRYLATALYKLAYANARVPKEDLKKVEGMKAFFINDPSRSLTEIRELKEIDADMSGTIDTSELQALRTKKMHLSFADKLMEVLSTHPNMLKRIKSLSSLT
jgi:heat shock protein HtpX